MQIVLWELLTEKRPYEGKYGNIHQLIDAVSNRNERPEIPENCPKKLRQLMERCWHKDPKQRPSFQEILESKVFDDIILEALTQGNEACQQMWKNFGPVSNQTDSRIKRHKLISLACNYRKRRKSRGIPSAKPSWSSLRLRTLAVKTFARNVWLLSWMWIR